MAKKTIKADTKLNFIGGVNSDRIGGNCSIIEHTDEKGETTRIMFDLGTMFTPYESGFDAALPNVEDYFARKNPKTGEVTQPLKPVSVLFLTHAHEDHIGALIDYTKMGYELPEIRASRFTRALIRLAFKQEGLDAPNIELAKPQDNIRVGENVVVEPFDVSHSIIGAMGYHTLTFVNDKPYAGIINNGDFLTEENMPIGNSFSADIYKDLMSRKLTTHVELDSTSTRPNSSNRIGFDQAVENTLNAIRQNHDRNIIISPVISRSVQNIAIDIEVARRLGTKICLDGKWLDLVNQAMMLSGHNDFEDVVYKGKLEKYLADKNIRRKYIVNTGAFAQGLEEYEKNQSDTYFIPMASATKMALDLHKDFKLNKDVLVVARQRIIDEINGKTGPKMLPLMASKGAKVIITPCGKKIGNFEEVQMQDSGHVNAEAMGNLMSIIKQEAPKAVIIPIHGNPKQCQDTADIAHDHNLKTHIASNMNILHLSQNGVVEEKDEFPFTWIGVKKLHCNPLDPDNNIPVEGKTEYWHIDENYMPIEKIGEAENVRIYRHGDKNYKISQGKLFDDKYEDAIFSEPINRTPRKGKIKSRKSKENNKEAKILAKKERILAQKEKMRKKKEQKQNRISKLHNNSKSFEM